MGAHSSGRFWGHSRRERGGPLFSKTSTLNATAIAAGVRFSIIERWEAFPPVRSVPIPRRSVSKEWDPAPPGFRARWDRF